MRLFAVLFLLSLAGCVSREPVLIDMSAQGCQRQETEYSYIWVCQDPDFVVAAPLNRS